MYIVWYRYNTLFVVSRYFCLFVSDIPKEQYKYDAWLLWDNYINDYVF